MINSDYLKWLYCKLLFGGSTYQALCEKQWIISPAEVVTTPNAIYLDKELDKVTSVQEETSYNAELKRLKGGTTEHAKTIAFQLRNAQISNGYLYKRGMKLKLTKNKESFFSSDRLERFSEAALACTFCGNKYFGHWFTDDLTLTLASQQLTQAVTTKQSYTAHQAEYMDILDIQSTQVSNATFNKLIITQDFGQNSYKRERYEYIRSKLNAQYGIEKNTQKKLGVMLLRGNSGVHRPLVNEKQIAEFLKQQGFVILNAEKESAFEIARLTSQAEIVIGVEGSQLVHGLFTLKEGGVLLALQPPFRFNNVFKDYTDCLELKYSFVVGKQVDNGFKIDLNDLIKTLDLLNL